MRILQIVPQIPYPLDNGARIGVFNITKYLALRGHSITMLALSQKEGFKPRELEKYCHLEVISKDTQNRVAGMFFNLFSQKPYTISKYDSLGAKQRLKEIMSQGKIDIVHVDHLHIAAYGKFLKAEWGVPIVLREHNVENTIWKRFYQLQNNPLIKAYAFFQYKKVTAYEKMMCQSFDRILVNTKEDQERIKKLNPHIKISIIPGGVDTSYFFPQLIEEEPYTITFVGSMDWAANIDGVLWFVEKVFPLIQQKYPRMKLCLVGSNPVKKINILKSAFIDVRPNVPDVREYIAKAKVFVVPLRIGGGMRLKILEAFAMQRAVVSTSVGCEGIEVENNRELMIADDEHDFAQQVVSLLSDREKRVRLGKQGYDLVKRKYSWEKVAESFEAVYEKIIQNSKPRE